MERNKWHCAIYLRLSKDDENKGESNSITTQKQIICNFLQTEQITNYQTYIDDGYSGTNFNRPAFENMLTDIKSGKINCVIVKDLSRFGRNYYETGRYLETVFQILRVRFISINDRIDSYKNPTSLQNATVSFKNVINDEYARDISNKIRKSLNAKQKRGEFIGSFAPFGYKKDEKNHNKLVIDEKNASIVKEIFKMFLEGNSILSIARTFSNRGIYCNSHPKSKTANGIFNDSFIRRMLKNRVYLGEMVQKKTQILSYKVGILINNPKEDWITVKDTHQPIISQEIFEKVQHLLKKKCRASPKTSTIGIFAGLIRCADCGKPMVKKSITQPNKTYHYYCCSTYRKQKQCSKHTTLANNLENTVLKVLQKHIEIAVEANQLLNSFNQAQKNSLAKKHIQDSINLTKKEISKTQKILNDLYPDHKDGLITKEQYLNFKQIYENTLQNLNKSFQNLQAQLQLEIPTTNGFISAFIKYKNITHLNREITTTLIHSIKIHRDGTIEIKLNFQDEFASIQKISQISA